MKNFPLLEICVETLDAALAANRGGAGRIELCENLRAGGVTPSAELMCTVRKHVQLPVFAMIRPRIGNFVYSDLEFAEMIRDIEIAKKWGMNGVVFGLLDTEKRVDVKHTRLLVELARPLPVTFHRAFDDARNLAEALENVIATGAARVLTSGGKPNAEQGAATIAELVDMGRARINVVPGGGISPANIESILRITRASEVHSGLSTVLPSPVTDIAVFESEVRKLAKLVKNHVLV